MNSAHESGSSYAQRKDALRHAARSARRTRPAEARTSCGRALAEVLLAALPSDRFGTVSAYVATADEPPTGPLLDALRGRGTRVLLPVVGDDGLDWAEYEGEEHLAPARWGLAEPTGRRLGAAALADADAVLVPAMLVDRAGRRLGRGGGYYDRALVRARPGVPRIALVFDEEVVDEVPAEDHDQPVTAAATPSGLVRLGGR